MSTASAPRKRSGSPRPKRSVSLRVAGLINYPRAAAASLTVIGRGFAHPSGTIGSEEELRERIYAKISKSQRSIVEVLIDAYPESISKNDLADRSGASVISSGYTNNLSTLRTL